MTKEEAIARIKNFKEQCPEDWETAIEAFNMAIEALEIIKMLGESVDAYILGKKKEPKKGEWIPVSERLPEDSKEYSVTVQHTGWNCEPTKFTSTSKYNPKTRCFECEDEKWRGDKVVAWMPKPEPYKEKAVPYTKGNTVQGAILK